jgi:septal ring factor EnvC (AmiA/AmiB activator)
MNWRVVLSGLCIAAALVGVGAARAPAPAPSLGQVEAEQQRREQDRQAARAAADAARSDLAELQAQLDELDLAGRQGDRVISDKRLRLAALNARETELKAKLGGAQAELARLLSVLALIRRDPPPALLVEPTRVRDAVRAAILVRAVTPELARRAKALQDQLAELQRTRRAAASASEDLFTTESAVADRRAQIETLAAQKAALERKANNEADAAAQDAEALAARAMALRNLAQGLANARPTSSPEPPDPEHAGPFGGREPFTSPVPGPPLRRFGQVDPDGGGRSLGWTWQTAGAALVVAPAAGVVEYAGPLKGWGVVLILRLGGGYHLVLAGLETALVQPERLVKAGEPVGRMAAAGRGSGEFYLEIRQNGAPVDPARWLAPMRGLRH